MLAKMWRSRNSNILLVGLQISATTLENSVEDPQKNGNEPTVRPSNTTSRHLPKRTETKLSD